LDADFDWKLNLKNTQSPAVLSSEEAWWRAMHVRATCPTFSSLVTYSSNGLISGKDAHYKAWFMYLLQMKDPPSAFKRLLGESRWLQYQVTHFKIMFASSCQFSFQRPRATSSSNSKGLLQPTLDEALSWALEPPEHLAVVESKLEAVEENAQLYQEISWLEGPHESKLMEQHLSQLNFPVRRQSLLQLHLTMDSFGYTRLEAELNSSRLDLHSTGRASDWRGFDIRTHLSSQLEALLLADALPP